MQQGFIKIHRSLTEWEWYTEPNTLRVFLHLLLMATHKQIKWKGIELMPGQLITGRLKLAQDLKLSEREIRTSLTRLKSTNEIAIKTTNKFSIVTICKWEFYQDKQPIERPTERPAISPSSDQQTTIYKNVKNEKKNNRVIFTPPTLQEVRDFFSEKGYSPEAALRAFDYYNTANWKDSTGKQVKNWKQKFISVWFKPENEQKKQVNGYGQGSKIKSIMFDE